MKVLLRVLLIIIIITLTFHSVQAAYWIRTDSIPDTYIYSILYSKTHHALYAGTSDFGIYKSTDLGNSWQLINNGLTDHHVFYLCENSTGILFAGTNGSGVYRSTDGGDTWIGVSNGLDNKNVLCMAIGPQGEIYAGSMYYGHVFRSSNNGDNWVNIGVDGDIYAIQPISNQTILVGTDFQGIFKTTDAGNSWNVTGLISYDISGISTGRNNRIFAGTSNGPYYSDDNGNTWTLFRSGLESNYVSRIIFQGNGDSLYVGLGITGGVFLSTDNGNYWNNYNDGMPGCTVFGFAKDSNGIVYVATDKGIYKTYINNDVEENETVNNPIKMIISPNPASDKITMEFVSDNTGKMEISIHNIYGAIQKKYDVSYPVIGHNSLTVDIRDLQPGVYVCSVISKNGLIMTGKFTVVR